MISTILSGFHLLVSSSQQPYEIGIIIHSTVQTEKLREKEDMWPIQEYTEKTKELDFKPRKLSFKSSIVTTIF